jgi:hypothetical protein
MKAAPRSYLAARIAGAVLVAIFLFVMSGCNGMTSSITGVKSSHARPSSTVGLAGLTLQSPTTPQQPEGDPPRSAPLAGVRLELRNAQGVAGSATSGNDGRFMIEVAAGAYTLRATPPNQMSRLPLTLPITVPENGMAEITLTFDSGIR